MRKVIILIVSVLFLGCVEPFEFGTQTFESALVIEATLTNEMKQHQILLSRATRFEDSTAMPERNARVRIIDDTQNEYDFFETSPGTYISTTTFAAQKNKKYSLVVNTGDGSTYRSSQENFESESQIENVYAEREENNEGIDGMAIFLDSYDPSGVATYYRYTYDETYKIIAPNWNSVDFFLTNYDPCALPAITYDLEIRQPEEEQQVCYKTINSNKIIQTSAVSLSESRIERFPFRFIESSDFILSHRYSVLVKQFVQSADAFSYYENVQNFSSSESVFSEIQPGFLNGNIEADGSPNQLVLGYFEVASVSEKRLFFNYRDFYPEEPLPLYVNKCIEFSAPLEHQSFCAEVRAPNQCPQSLLERINLNLISYVGANGSNIGSCPGPYVVVPRECGDCTVIGSNIVPDFWEE